MRSGTSTLTESLAGYWSSARYEDLPPEAVRLAKRFLIDTLAAGIAGAGTEVPSIVLDAVGGSSPTEAGAASIVWGRSELLPAREAALVNGTSSHALELDDFGGCGHSGAVVIPAVCALASGSSGKAMLTAIIAGYDVAARVLEGAGGYRAHNDLGWHSSGTAGSFGAAATASAYWKLNCASSMVRISGRSNWSLFCSLPWTTMRSMSPAREPVSFTISNSASSVACRPRQHA